MDKQQKKLCGRCGRSCSNIFEYSGQIMENWIKGLNSETKKALAAAPDTCSEELKVLINDADLKVREAVINNQNTTEEVLNQAEGVGPLIPKNTPLSYLMHVPDTSRGGLILELDKPLDEIDKLFEQCKELHRKKGIDYTRGSLDKLDNFKKAAIFVGSTPEQALGTLLYKQISSIFSYIEHRGAFESEPINSRIMDAINYLALFYLMVNEKKDGQ